MEISFFRLGLISDDRQHRRLKNAFCCLLCFRGRIAVKCVWNYHVCPLRQVSKNFSSLRKTCFLLHPESFTRRQDLDTLLKVMKNHKIHPTLAKRFSKTVSAIREIRKLLKSKSISDQRLYSLSENDYTRWAEEVWRVKGRPVHPDVVISGVVFGEARIKTATHRGYRVVLSRKPGVTPVRENGRVKIKITCPE